LELSLYADRSELTSEPIVGEAQLLLRLTKSATPFPGARDQVWVRRLDRIYNRLSKLLSGRPTIRAAPENDAVIGPDLKRSAFSNVLAFVHHHTAVSRENLCFWLP
jgi:hypothetical protein